jgi:hypothetical protein
MSNYPTYEPPPPSQPGPPPPSGSSGMGMCLLGCLGIGLLALVLCGGGIYYVVTNAKALAIAAVRQIAVAAVEKSQIPDEEKREVIAQIDRVAKAYKDGQISDEQMQRIFNELGDSPIIQSAIGEFAYQQYVVPSDLSAAEKAEARLTLQRVARGLFEKKISEQDLQPAMDYITLEGPANDKKFKESLTREELEGFLDECRRAADDAGIPEEPFTIDYGDEVKKAIDRALAEP